MCESVSVVIEDYDIGVRYTPLRRYLATPAAAHDPRSVSQVLRRALAWLLKAYPIANLGLR